MELLNRFELNIVLELLPMEKVDPFFGGDVA